MSINFLDITYVIIFSLVQCSTAMALKSPKYYTSRYIKKPLKTTFYIHIPYKARKILDYNYQDWDEKQPDVYDYLLPTTKPTPRTVSALIIINSTDPQESFRPDASNNPTLDSFPYSSSNNPSLTYSTLPSNESTPGNSSPTPSIDSNPLSILPSFSDDSATSPYNMITLTPELTVNKIMVTTTPLDIQKNPVSESIGDEVLKAKAKVRGLYFTAGVYVLLKIIERKKKEDVTPLLYGLQGEFSRLNHHHRLAMFGPLVNSVFTVMVLKLTTVPVELIQAHAKKAQKLLENKKKSLELDTRAIFDVADSIYIEEDYHRIVDSLTDIQNFPNVTKPEIKVAEEAIEAFIMQPYRRIEGNAKEKLLLMEIHKVVEKRMAVNETKTLRRYFRNHIKMASEMSSSSENIIKFRGKTFTKAHMRMPFVWPTLYTDPTTINSYETDYTSYVTDPKIMKRLKHKMIIYKQRNKKIRSQENRLKTKRGMTSTTTTTTTTTEMPPMHKSKYYMMKYVNKNLYKMKISTPKTTIFRWKYYGKVRTKNFNDFRKKIMDIDKLDVKKYSLSNDFSESEDYYSDSEEDDYETDAHKSNDFTRSITPTILKTLSHFNTNKNDLTNHILYNNKIIKSEESEMEIEDINKIQRFNNKPDNSESNAEAYLKINLNDALLHTNNITINRRFITKKVNKLHKMDSFSDDEAILKGNIYKVFGYSNDFAKQLRAIL